ncbi:unnamed protein product, partial [Allacma fusca]
MDVRFNEHETTKSTFGKLKFYIEPNTSPKVVKVMQSQENQPTYQYVTNSDLTPSTPVSTEVNQDPRDGDLDDLFEDDVD